ncbi:jg26259, partial [Pararge aegeria aegeria]
MVCSCVRVCGVWCVDDIEELLPGVVYHTQPLIQPYPPPQAKAEQLIGDPDVPVEAT